MSLTVQQLAVPDGVVFVSANPVLGVGMTMPINTCEAQTTLVNKVGAGGFVFVARRLCGGVVVTGLFETAREALKCAYDWLSSWTDDKTLREGEFEDFAKAHFDTPAAVTTLNSDRHTTLAPGFYPLQSEFISVVRATVR